MGGANSIFNMFDPNEQQKKAQEQANQANQRMRFENVPDANQYGDESDQHPPMDIQTPKIQNEEGLAPAIQEERGKDFDNYEVNTYM